MQWLDILLENNKGFRQKIDLRKMPVERVLHPFAVVTCMDPRVNIASIGALPFESTGEIQSHVRIIRTIGAIAEDRSIVIGIHLAGFKEIAILMHTDCGCSVAYAKIDVLISNMERSLHPEQLAAFKKKVGEPFREKLIEWLHAFQDPRESVKKEISALRKQPFVPSSTIIHGLVYDLNSGSVEIVVNGYE